MGLVCVCGMPRRSYFIGALLSVCGLSAHDVAFSLVAYTLHFFSGDSDGRRIKGAFCNGIGGG